MGALRRVETWMSASDWLTTPRVQVPVAATVFVVLVAAVVLVTTVGAVSPESVPVALLVVAPLAFFANQSLFVRARTPRAAYVRAVLWPPAAALLVGSGVVTWMVQSHPDAEYSFGGPPIVDVGVAWPLFVAVGAVMLGCVVSAFLALEVWLVARTTDRTWTPVWAWCGVALASAAAVPFMPLLGIAMGGVATSVASLLAVHALRRARSTSTIERGPYRSTTAR